MDFQGTLWDAHHECTPAVPGQFNRIAIHVGKPDQPAKLDFANPPVFVCKTNDKKVVGSFKGHEKFGTCTDGSDCDPEADPTDCADGSDCVENKPINNHEVWSAEFDNKCTGTVNVYLKVDPARPPGWKPVIKVVVFSREPNDVPAVSAWGLVAIVLLVLTAGTIVIARRRQALAT